jgi:hypothetical protein
MTTQHDIAVDLIIKAANSTISTNDAVEALKAYAAGKDGVLGTADDKIDPNILDALTYLVEMGVAQKIIDLVRKDLPAWRQKITACFSCSKK